MQQKIMNGVNIYMQEIWKTVITPYGIYENYQVSNLGRVKSLKRKVWNGKAWYIKEEKLLSLGTDGKKYLQVKLTKNGKAKMYKIHKLVAYAFIPNVMNYKEIDHKDTNSQNNSISNLIYVTHKQNMNNELTKAKMKGKILSKETRKKMSKARKGEKHYMYGKHHSDDSKKKMSKSHISKRVICIETKEIFNSINEASRKLGIHSGNIAHVCNRRRKQAHNLTFRYLDQVLFYN